MHGQGQASWQGRASDEISLSDCLLVCPLLVDCHYYKVSTQRAYGVQDKSVTALLTLHIYLDKYNPDSALLCFHLRK